MRRVLVCGGRDYTDTERVHAALDALHDRGGIALVIEGGATGADAEARAWARSRGVEVLTLQADWQRHGRAAGPIRNQAMLEVGRPDGVVAFPGGRGTADMVRRAEAAGLMVWRPFGAPPEISADSVLPRQARW